MTVPLCISHYPPACAHSCIGNERCRFKSYIDSTGFCQCDDLCDIYGDCCFDYERECLGNSSPWIDTPVPPLPPIPVNTDSTGPHPKNFTSIEVQEEIHFDPYLEHVLQLREEQYWVQVLSRNISSFVKGLRCMRPTRHSNAYFLKETCSIATLTTNLCRQQSSASDKLSLIPVYGVDQVHYKNVFCALCNGLEKSNVRFWHLEYHDCKNISESDYNKTTVLDEKCNLKIKFRNVFIEDVLARVCSDDLKTNKLTECDDQIKDACARYSAPVVINGSLYKNPHCAECSRWNTSTLDLYSSYMIAHSCDDVQTPDFSSMVIFYDFYDDRIEIHKQLFSQGVENVASIKFLGCEQERMFDPFLDQCRELYAPDNGELVEGTNEDISNSSCEVVVLNSTQFIWLSIDRLSFRHQQSGAVVTAGDFKEISDSEVQICKNIYDGFSRLRLFYAKTKGQVLFRNVGMGISIMFLSIVLLTYLSFSELRNVPGKTVMSLSGALLLAQLLFVVGNDKTGIKPVCLVITLFVHYTWLSVFFWTNVLSFDLACTFGGTSGKTSGGGGGSSSFKFVKYSTYAWISPAFLVGLTAVVHFIVPIKSNTESIYDIKHSCWLRQGTPTLVALVVPMTCFLLVNWVLFLYTIIGIQHTRAVTKMVQRSGDKTKQIKRELFFSIKVRYDRM